MKGSPSHLSFPTENIKAAKVSVVDPWGTPGSSGYPLVASPSSVGFSIYWLRTTLLTCTFDIHFNTLTLSSRMLSELVEVGFSMATRHRIWRGFCITSQMIPNSEVAPPALSAKWLLEGSMQAMLSRFQMGPKDPVDKISAP